MFYRTNSFIFQDEHEFAAQKKGRELACVGPNHCCRSQWWIQQKEHGFLCRRTSETSGFAPLLSRGGRYGGLDKPLSCRPRSMVSWGGAACNQPQISLKTTQHISSSSRSKIEGSMERETKEMARGVCVRFVESTATNFIKMSSRLLFAKKEDRSYLSTSRYCQPFQGLGQGPFGTNFLSLTPGNCRRWLFSGKRGSHLNGREKKRSLASTYRRVDI